MTEVKSQPFYKIDIRSWGPATWDFLHAVSFTYPKVPTEREITVAKEFFGHIENVLPCGKCRAHFGTFLKENPLTLKSTRALSEWVAKVHNDVNRRSKSRVVPYLETVATFLPPDMYDSIDPTPEELTQLNQLHALRKKQHAKKLPKANASSAKADAKADASASATTTEATTTAVPSSHVGVLVSLFLVIFACCCVMFAVAVCK